MVRLARVVIPGLPHHITQRGERGGIEGIPRARATGARAAPADTDPIAEQHAVLCQKLRGHAGYYGIVGNSPALARFYHEVLKVWRKWLVRRRRAWRGSWDWFNRLKQRYPVPYLRVIHSARRGVANG